MIEAVIFDLDDTLYDYKNCNTKSEEKLFSYAGNKLGIEPEKFKEAYSVGRRVTKELLLDSAALHSRLLYCQHALEHLGINPVKNAIELADYFWECFLNEMQPFPGVNCLLEELKKNSLKIGICTDMTTEIQYKKILKLGLGDYIDCIVTSEEVGNEKPNGRMLTLCSNKLNSKFQAMLMIGDNFEKDIRGSLALGMAALWFNPSISEIQKVEERLIVTPTYLNLSKNEEVVGLFHK